MLRRRERCAWRSNHEGVKLTRFDEVVDPSENVQGGQVVVRREAEIQDGAYDPSSAS